jgi:hypothetical protein
VASYTRAHDFADQTVAKGDEIAQELDAIAAALQALNDTNMHFAVCSGLVNNYTLTVVGQVIAYVNGLHIAFAPHITNTGAVFVNVNGLGNRQVLYPGDNPLVSDELLVTAPSVIEYYNDAFYLVSLPLTYRGPQGIQGLPGVNGLDYYRAVTVGSTLTVADGAKSFDVTATGVVLSLPLVSNAPDGWYFKVRNSSTGVLSLLTLGGDTINGVTLMRIPPGEMYLVISTGSLFKAIMIESRQRSIAKQFFLRG